MPEPDLSTPDWVCSDQHLSGPFGAHGRFRGRFADGIYWLECRGPFNAEAMAAGLRARRAMMARWPAPAAGVRVLSTWFESAMMPPEAYAHFERGLSDELAYGHPPDRVAWVADASVDGLALMLPVYARVYAQHAIAFRLFDRRDEALQWLLDGSEA